MRNVFHLKPGPASKTNPAKIRTPHRHRRIKTPLSTEMYGPLHLHVITYSTPTFLPIAVISDLRKAVIRGKKRKSGWVLSLEAWL